MSSGVKRIDANLHRVLLDHLPVSRRYIVDIASDADLPELFGLSVRHLPQLAGAESVARRIHDHSRSVLSVRTRDRIVGAVSFLPLNDSGFQRLLSDDLDIANPRTDALCQSGEIASALYAWSLCLPGFAVGAMGNVMAWLRQPSLARADIYARPGTFAGERFMRRTGYQRLATTLMGEPLWHYCRPN